MSSLLPDINLSSLPHVNPLSVLWNPDTMKTIRCMAGIVAQIPASIHDQFQIKIQVDAYFLRVVVMFRHTSGTTIEAVVLDAIPHPKNDMHIPIPDEIIAKLCVIAS